MPKKNGNAVNEDIKVLIKDAQVSLQAAATMTGDRAEEMQNRVMHLLDAAMDKAQEVHADALATGKKIAASTDGYVKENPWRSIATGAGVGLLLGVILGRR